MNPASTTGIFLVALAALGAEIGYVSANEHVVVTDKTVVFSASHYVINTPSVLAMAGRKTGSLIWAVQHPQAIRGCFLAADGLLVAMAEDRRMLLVRIADGKSVSFSPLPDKNRGEFAGVVLDQGQLFIVGADAHVWRLPFDSVKVSARRLRRRAGNRWELRVSNILAVNAVSRSKGLPASPKSPSFQPFAPTCSLLN